MSDVQIRLPSFCDRHLYRLVHGAKYKDTDPWRALVIAAQIALFQGASTLDSVHKKLGGDITKVESLGCFACRLPHKFNDVIRVAKHHDIKKIKELGESWVKEKTAVKKEGED